MHAYIDNNCLTFRLVTTMNFSFNKNAVLKGTVILTLAGIISRIAGFFYRIFLTRQIGADGIGMFQLVTPVLGIAFALCSAGIQTAISRFCAAKKFQSTWLFAGLAVALPLSVLFTSFTYAYADFIAVRIFLNKDCSRFIQILAITVPFCTFHNCVNGYYLGKKQAGLPAFSQLFEQFARIGAVYLYTVYCTQNELPVSVLCAVYGNLAGEAASCLICVLALLIDKTVTFRFHSLPECIKKTVVFSIPLTANRLLMHLLQSGESILIPAQLVIFGNTQNEALSIYGILMGMSLPLILFPSAITNSMAVMLLPEVSGAQADGDNARIVHTLNRSLQICMAMGFLSTALFLFYGAKMGAILFKEPLVENFVMILAWLCPFYYLTTTLGSILNGLGCTTLTCVQTIAGILVRIAFLVLLVPKTGIRGYLIGTLVSQILVCIAHFLYLNHLFHIGFPVWKYILQPLLYTAVSILFSQMFCRLLLFLGTDSLFFRLFTGACCAVFIFTILIKSSFLTAECTRL